MPDSLGDDKHGGLADEEQPDPGGRLPCEQPMALTSAPLWLRRRGATAAGRQCRGHCRGAVDGGGWGRTAVSGHGRAEVRGTHLEADDGAYTNTAAHTGRVSSAKAVN